MTERRPLGIYVHLPFCRRKCSYCDFCSYPGREGDIPVYVDALCREIAARPAPGRRVDTVYLGGGTPSLLPPTELSRLLSSIVNGYSVASDAELTLEVNPCTVTRERMAAYRALGINRISMGVQSLSDRALQALGRLHTAKEAIDAYRTVREVGFDNVSLDLMTGLPGETPEELSATVHGFLSLSPEHISAYSLMLEEGTPLAASPLRRTVPDEDASAEAMEATAATLGMGGYRRYEISNYAYPGKESRHNLRYWRGGEYIGLGVAAYSYVDGVRFGAPRDLDGYLSGRSLPTVDREVIDPTERERERVMLSLRLAEGIDRAAYLLDFGRDVHTLLAPVLSRYREFFTVTDTAIALTGRGMSVSNTLILECLAALEE